MGKKRSRAAYDVPEELRNALNEISDELGVPPGRLLALFGFEGILRYLNGEINIDELKEPHPRSLKYPYTLNLDEYIKKFGKK